jgi:hypothetical protein
MMEIANKQQLAQDIVDLVEAASQAVELKRQLDEAIARIEGMRRVIDKHEETYSSMRVLLISCARPVVIQSGDNLPRLLAMAPPELAALIEPALEQLRREAKASEA